MAACHGGDLAALLEQLAPEVTLCTDGGGKVARFLAGIHPSRFRRQRFQCVELNGQPGALTWLGDTLDGAISIDVVDGAIQWVGIVTNPDKLAALPARLSRIAQNRQ